MRQPMQTQVAPASEDPLPKGLPLPSPQSPLGSSSCRDKKVASGKAEQARNLLAVQAAAASAIGHKGRLKMERAICKARDQTQELRSLFAKGTKGKLVVTIYHARNMLAGDAVRWAFED